MCISNVHHLKTDSSACVSDECALYVHQILFLESLKKHKYSMRAGAFLPWCFWCSSTPLKSRVKYFDWEITQT